MKILLVTPSFFPIVGGSEVLTRILSVKLNEIGIHADIMTLNMSKKWNPAWKERIAKSGQVMIFREPALNPFPRLSNPLFNLLRMNVVPKPSFAAKFRDYDVIHFIGEADLSFPLLSFFVRKPKLLQCVAFFRNGGIYKYYKFDRAFLGRIFKRFFPSLANFFVVSSNEERGLLSDMGVPTNRILILPIGVDTKMFHPDKEKKSGNLVLFIGRIERIKGLHVLMEALSYLEVPILLVIIGPRVNEEYAKEIGRMASAINENGFHRVMLLEQIDQSDLVPWYQKAAVLVCPYLYETGSNVVRESLACGTPVVSTGSHIVETGSDGILLTSKDPRSLANSLSRLLRDGEMRENLGREGRDTAERYLSWESIVRDLAKVYQGMVNARDE